MHLTADIQVLGARENNLRDVSVTIPKGKLTVFTGVSGSGKSSLVFDTIAAESQRQLNETFSAFIRNRLPQFPKPDVDLLSNLAVAILVDQKPFGGNARSTVGTATDLAPLLRLLFSRHGTPFVGYSNVFSFNDPAGMCPECQGLGTVSQIDPAALIDPARSLDDGAIRFPTFAPGTAYWKRYVFSGLFDRTKPIMDYSPAEWSLLMEAAPRMLTEAPPEWPRTSPYEGILTRFRRLYVTQDAAKVRQRYREDFDRVVTVQNCPLCHGARLNQRTLTCTIDGRTIADVARMQITDLIPVMEAITAPAVATVVAALVAGLTNLNRIGLGYLSLDRVSSTLSGGEAQRVKMVRHLSSSLTDLTYILDEPSTGLHPRDVQDLTQLLTALRDKGNTVLVVEHDPDLISVADHIIDLGPGAGSAGGRIVFQGSVVDLRRADTPTGRYLRAPRRLKAAVRHPVGAGIEIRHANTHNLQDVTVTIPTGVMTVVTGVAGSGKSSLINEELARQEPAAVFIDQSAIRGSRRSTPATFVQILDPIRREFARANNVGVEWFSPNSAGACPACDGLGVVITDLAFMEELVMPCDACHGTRFNQKALGYRLHGRNIHDVFMTTVADAGQLFADAGIAGAIQRLLKVGLGYITLGQPLSSLSGGERQRLKLARELVKAGRLYVFDEPTTGLHGRDTAHLLTLFDELVDDGATLIVIEHNLDVVVHADWIIDLGPGPGRAGGRVIFAGRPADLVKQSDNATADHLRAYLGSGGVVAAADLAAR